MNVERDRVVRFHYELRDESGEALETSRAGDPITMLYGHGGLVPGVESALAGRAAGQRFEVRLAPEDAYGPRRQAQVQRLQKKYLRKAGRLRPGMQLTIPTEHGPRPVTVVKVGSSVVDVDLNHPLAGRTLDFDIEILDVREADAEEIAHGHVHGSGGDHHG
jgi:FKBP-type peptidyl-prolyl cis-trans isomerase SlyD